MQIRAKTAPFLTQPKISQGQWSLLQLQTLLLTSGHYPVPGPCSVVQCLCSVHTVDQVILSYGQLCPILWGVYQHRWPPLTRCQKQLSRCDNQNHLGVAQGPLRVEGNVTHVELCAMINTSFFSPFHGIIIEIKSIQDA